MKIKCNFILSITIVSIILLCAKPNFAQTSSTGALGGTIFDSSGAVLPDANVVVTSETTGQTNSTISQASGRYLVPLLPPGSYRIDVRKAGFKVATKSGIRGDVVEARNREVVVAGGD